jgi:ribosomal protein S18 acetylase RimI-like enzyme
VASRDLGVAMMRLGADSMRAHMLAEPALIRRHGFSVVTRGGMLCFASTKIAEGVFNHVSGYATFSPATQRGIDAVLRHYDRLGCVARFEVLTPVVARADRALLARNGFRDLGAIFQCHVRTADDPPRVREVRGLTVERVTRAGAVRYAKAATAGFGGGGTIANVFERGWIHQLRHSTRPTAFLGSLNGTPAGTGVLFRGHGIAALYSGSVLKRFRGRGIQNAMIAARLVYGWAHGIHSFYSWTDDENNASAHNLHDEGFRTRYQVHMYRRPGDG